MPRYGPQGGRQLSGRRGGSIGRRLKALLVVLAALVLFAAVGRRAISTFVRGYTTAAEVLELEDELREAQRETERLRAWRDEAATEESQALEARRQLMLVRKGERVLSVEEDEETKKAVAAMEGRQRRSGQPEKVLGRWLVSPGEDDSAPPASTP